MGSLSKGLKHCRVCEYLECMDSYDSTNNLQRKKHWLEIARLKKLRVEELFLRPCRALQQFCCTEHFEIAEEWQKNVERENKFKLQDLNAGIELSSQDVKDAQDVVNYVVMRHIDNPNADIVLEMKENLRKAKISYSRRCKLLDEYYEYMKKGA